MSMSKRWGLGRYWYVGAVCVLVCIVSVVMMLGSHPEQLQKDLQEAVVAPSRRASAPNAQSPYRVPVTAAADESSKERLISEGALARFESGHSLRSLVMDGIANPGNGMAFYGLKALNDCRIMDNFSSVRDVVQPENNIGAPEDSAHRQIEAVDYVKRRCEGLLPSEIDELTRRINAAAPGSVDPLLAAEREFLASVKSGNASDKRQALSQIFAVHDPALLDAVGIMVGLNGRDDDSALRFRFDGKDYRLRDDPSISAAVSLVPCELGLRCDAKEGLIGLHCADSGNCPSGRYEDLALGIFKNDPDAYRQAVNLARRMADAIRAGNVGAFTN